MSINERLKLTNHCHTNTLSCYLAGARKRGSPHVLLHSLACVRTHLRKCAKLQMYATEHRLFGKWKIREVKRVLEIKSPFQNLLRLSNKATTKPNKISRERLGLDS